MTDLDQRQQQRLEQELLWRLRDDRRRRGDRRYREQQQQGARLMAEKARKAAEGERAMLDDMPAEHQSLFYAMQMSETRLQRWGRDVLAAFLGRWLWLLLAVGVLLTVVLLAMGY